MIDEKHEREEQEELLQREQRMLDLAAAQQDAQNAEAREAAGDVIEEEEHDLDDDVPEAEEEASESDLSATESGSEEDGTRQDVTFNEDSFIEGSMMEGQVSHMLAMEEASMSGALQDERDLDDDIPEAGEYEHTDSSQLDSSEDEPTQASFVQSGRRRRSGRRSSGAPRRSTGQMGQMGHPVPPVQSSRLSVDLEGSSSFLDGSSFLRSSPAAVRGSLRARFLGARGGR